MMRRCLLLSVLILIFGIFGGCGHAEEQSTVNKEKDDKIQIGMSFDSFVIERWNREKEIFVATASEQGAEVNVQNAGGDLDTQREQIKYLINKGMDVIVIIAVDSNGLSDIVKEAVDSGIKVIAYDRLINDAEIDLYISFDNRQVGVLMAKALMNATGNTGKYLMLSGPTTDNNVNMIEDGFRATVKKYESGINIIGYMNAVNWKAEYVYEYLERNIDTLNEVDGIMCGNDNLATQAIRFLAEKGLAGEIPVVGQDADLEACQHVVEGTQLMTVYKPVEKLAQKAVECSIKLANGDAGVTLTGNTMPNGRYNCPYINLDPVAVDKNNMDDVVIADGFHLKEEVYLNISDKKHD